MVLCFNGNIIRNPERKIFTADLYLCRDEASIAGSLNALVDKYSGRVAFGSYPDWHHSYYKVRINMETKLDEKTLNAARDDLKQAVGSENVVDFDPHAIANAEARVYTVAQEATEFGRKVQRALHLIGAAMDKYGLSARPLALYMRSRQPFPEVEQFTDWAVLHYGLHLVRIEGRIKPALTEFGASYPHVEAVLMGTRRTDPRADHLDPMQMTDPDWPQFMRIHPILDWSYTDVWHFLRRLSVPYCTLYDRGYTSIDSMENTHPNPKLQYFDAHGIVRHRPAYTLADANSERSGRSERHLL